MGMTPARTYSAAGLDALPDEAERKMLAEICVCAHLLARHPGQYECLDCAEQHLAWPCTIFVSLADARRADAAPGKKWKPLP
jgi:hypothetical protein